MIPNGPEAQRLREEIYRAADQLAALKLSAFVRVAWRLIEPGRELVWGWHHDAICDHLEAVTNGEIRRLVINMPPGYSKSTIVTICWPVWEWIRNPNRRVIAASYSDDLAREASKKRILILESDWYRRVVESVHGKDAWDLRHATQKQAETSRTGFILATSVDGQATGRHADRIVIDDPLKAQDIYTVRLQRHVEWFRETMRTRVTSAERSAFVIVMQRLHQADLSGELIPDASWCHLCLESEFDPEPIDRRRGEDDPDPPHGTRIGWSDPRTEPGEPLFPARFPKEYLEHERGPFGLGPTAYNAQHQQRPIAGEGNMLRRAWWRFWSDDPSVEADTILPPEATEAWTSWDMSFKKAAETDFVVGQTWARVGADAFLLDQDRARMSFGDARRAVEALVKKWPSATRHLIEEKANGAAIIDQLKANVVGLIPINPGESKEARVSAISPLIEAGNVYLPHPALAYKDGTLRYPWVQQLIDETCAFPNGKYDDQVDALSQALAHHLKAVRRAGGWKPIEADAAKRRNPPPPPVTEETYLDPRGTLDRASRRLQDHLAKRSSRRRKKKEHMPVGLPSAKWEPDG